MIPLNYYIFFGGKSEFLLFRLLLTRPRFIVVSDLASTCISCFDLNCHGHRIRFSTLMDFMFAIRFQFCIVVMQAKSGL